MYELKTRPTKKNPLYVIAAIPNAKKQADAKTLLEVFKRATGNPPIIWGEKMIGYGSYHYKYATGHRGTIYATGFSVTKSKITLHLYFDCPLLRDYLERLGKLTTSKNCIYINKLADIDIYLLEKMIGISFEYVKELSEKTQTG